MGRVGEAIRDLRTVLRLEPAFDTTELDEALEPEAAN